MLIQLLAIYSSVAFQLELVFLHLITHKGFLIHEFAPLVFEAIQSFGIKDLL